jgi:hypothetical protein
MMNRVGEEAMNRITMEERQRPKLRTMDIEDIRKMEGKETEYGADAQGWGREGRKITTRRTKRYRRYKHLVLSGQKN